MTGRTWLLLIAAALLIAAGALNFSQRLRHQPPPWDGVTWIDTAQGMVGLDAEPSYEKDDPKAVEFSIDSGLKIEVIKPEDSGSLGRLWLNSP